MYLVGYGFEESSGPTVVDSSGSGNDGSLFNDATRVTGQYGQGVDCKEPTRDGVSLPADFNLIGETAFTIMLWFYHKSIGEPDPRLFAWAQTDSRNSTDIMHCIGVSSGTLYSRLRLSGETYQFVDSGSTQIPPNTWIHTALTYDDADDLFTCYLDGNVNWQFSTVGGPVDGRPTYLGRIAMNGGSTTRNFNGIVDEVRIYNHRLDQSEIIDDMNTPVVSGPTPVLGSGGLGLLGVGR